MADDAIKIFISYAHEDEDLQHQLRKHLDILGLDVWVDRQISAGAEWNDDIERELEDADIILLLLSVEFLSSDFVRKVEIPRALERHENGTSRVVPVLMRTVSWDHLPLAALQAIPSDERWVTGTGAWNSIDEALTNVAKSVQAVAKELELVRVDRLAKEQQAADDYRREVAEALSDGRISAIEKETLEDARLRLGLREEVAKEIEDGELHPYNEKQQNRMKYATSVRTAILEGGHPITAEFAAELKKRQAKLGLQDEDVSGIEDEVVATLELEQAAAAEQAAAEQAAAAAQAEQAAAAALAEQAARSEAAAEPAPTPAAPTGIAPTRIAPTSPPAGQPIVLPRMHSSCIRSLAFSPDGSLLASGSDDRTASLWSIETGASVTLSGHTGFVQCVAFSPDGRALATASADKTVHLFDVATGALISTLAGHTKGVESVAWAPDGTALVTGSDDRTVAIWDASTGQLIQALTGHTKGVASVAWSPDGTHVASASGDKLVVLWDLATMEGRPLAGHTSGVRSVAFLPDGTALASASDDHTVKLWDVTTGIGPTLTGHDNWVKAVAFSPDGGTIASGGDGKQLILWELATGVTTTRSGHEDPIFTVAYSPDGTLASAGGGMVFKGDNQVRLWAAADE